MIVSSESEETEKESEDDYKISQLNLNHIPVKHHVPVN